MSDVVHVVYVQDNLASDYNCYTATAMPSGLLSWTLFQDSTVTVSEEYIHKSSQQKLNELKWLRQYMLQ